MVPHLKVEEAIYSIIGEYACAVTGIPDDQRGERLVALYTRPDMTPQSCGSGSRKPACPSSGCRSARTFIKWMRCRR